MLFRSLEFRIFIPVRLTESFTVTLQEAFLFEPSIAWAVMVAVPAPTALTTPFELTVAALGLEDFQPTVFTAPFFAFTVAFNESFAPFSRVAFFCLSVTLVTGAFMTFTVIAAFFFLFDLEVTVIFVEPGLMPFMTPEALTEAILLFLDL